METVTSYFGISEKVPFVDVEVGADTRLYLDPYAIRLNEAAEPFVVQATYCMDSFFDEVVRCVIADTPASRERGERLLRKFAEPWETRLGMSRSGFHGHGGADDVGMKIWNALSIDLKALVRIGILKYLEELPLFVEGVDKDITSDITTRITFNVLASFTSRMMEKFPQFSEDGREVSVFTKRVWDPALNEWVDAKVALPVVEGKELLLVPEGWVGRNLLMSAGRYHLTSLLSFGQMEQATRGVDGKLLKTPKRVLVKQPGFEPGRHTNRIVTLRAWEKEQDLLSIFKKYVRENFKSK